MDRVRDHPRVPTIVSKIKELNVVRATNEPVIECCFDDIIETVFGGKRAALIALLYYNDNTHHRCPAHPTTSNSTSPPFWISNL